MDVLKISYYNEISLMMFGFGDSHKPNPDTVRHVESIVLNQLRMIVQEALKYTNDKTVRAEELVFLMRKNKYKMRRFIKYLQNKEARKTVNNLTTTGFVKEPQKNEIIEFIERIDETGELTDLSEFDQVKHERQLRADRISLALDEEKYMKFYKARCTSFKSKDMSQGKSLEKLRLWVDPRKDVNFTSYALDVLAYYAYETVAQLIDYALLVRMDMKSTLDPISNLRGSHYNSSMFNGEHRLSNTNPDYSKVYSGQPPISVGEIREVMRRVASPQAGKLCLGKKLPETHCILVL